MRVESIAKSIQMLKGILEAEAKRSGAFYVTERWLGGTLTNFQTIKKQIKRLKELEQGAADGEFANYTKKEQLLFDRERVKLDKNLAGIKNMGRLPGALFIVDSKKERIAVAEANGHRARTVIGHGQIHVAVAIEIGQRLVDRGYERRPGPD